MEHYIENDGLTHEQAVAMLQQTGARCDEAMFGDDMWGYGVKLS